MEIFGPLILSSIAGLSTVLGSFFIFVKIKKSFIDKFIAFCLSFSLSIMIGVSITELIPQSFWQIVIYWGFLKGFFMCLVTFLIGVFLIKKIALKIDSEDNLYKLGILNMIALFLHNLPEGIATFISSYQNINLGIKLTIAIMLHNIPEGISIAVPLYYATKNKKMAVFKTFLSGIAEPIGALLAFLFLKNYITDTMISIILILVAGIMISLSINKILPEAIKYQKNKAIILGLVTGFFLILISLFVF